MASKTADDDDVAKIVARCLNVEHVTEASEFAQCCFQYFRDDKGREDLDTIEISSLSEYVSDLKSFDSGKLSKMQAGSDKAYKAILRDLDTAEKIINKATSSGNNDLKKAASKIISNYSSAVSKAQGFTNTYLSEWKAAAKERDSAYKSMIIKAIAYSKKQEKNK